MKLASLRIKNFRSVRDSGEIRVESMQALVGENNAGKSNILAALQVFLAAGSDHVTTEDFYDVSHRIVIVCTFGSLHPHERRPPLRKYLLGDKLILEKQLFIEPDKRDREKFKVETAYHGYEAKPKDWWLTLDGVLAEKGDAFKDWAKLAEDNGLLDYVKDTKGKVTKVSYGVGLKKYLETHPEVEYTEPSLGETQALGLQTSLLDALPTFHLLPAITDYAEETDKRSTSSIYRRLMSDLSERLLTADPRFREITAALGRITRLLNAPATGEVRDKEEARLAVLGSIEEKLRDILYRMMPSVLAIRLEVIVGEINEVFSRGVSVWVDDGKETEVLRKGHGMQRCLVFAFLRALIMNQRGQLLSPEASTPDSAEIVHPTIILGIEEPELYIHPQCKRLIYSVLREFAGTDQVIYATHDTAFLDVAAYEEIAVVRKPSHEFGTQVFQCGQGVLGDAEDRKGFQFLNSFGTEQNQLFFAQRVVLVEGEQDFIGLISAGRQLGIFKEFPEEIGYSIICAGSKGELPKFMKLLSAFKIPFALLHELDGDPNSTANRSVKQELGHNRCVEVPNRVEDSAGYAGHFPTTYDAKMFFKNPELVRQEFKDVVMALFEPTGLSP
ncbi:MAG: AAA family ATPase [Candidatus Acidiferrales bacterium]